MNEKTVLQFGVLGILGIWLFYVIAVYLLRLKVRWTFVVLMSLGWVLGMVITTAYMRRLRERSVYDDR